MDRREDPATGLLAVGAVLAEATVLYVGYGRLPWVDLGLMVIVASAVVAVVLARGVRAVRRGRTVGGGS